MKYKLIYMFLTTYYFLLTTYSLFAASWSEPPFSTATQSVSFTTITASGIKLLTKPNWWNIDWKYRKPITIANSTSTLTDYQIFISTKDLNIPPNKRLSNWADIRFTDFSGSTLFNYWLETSTGFG